MVKPPRELTIDPDRAIKAGPLLYNWAKRARSGKESTAREMKAIVNEWPNLDDETRQALGGDATYQWANNEPIKVRALPYYGHNNGKDDDGQFFDHRTDFMEHRNPRPLILFTHGSQNNFSTSEVAEPVTDLYFEDDGGWIDILLDPYDPQYDYLSKAYKEGRLHASSGGVPGTIKYNEETGHIESWGVGEISLVVAGDGFQPKNKYAITKAHVKAQALFDDYYNDPVLVRGTNEETELDWENDEGFWAKLKDKFTSWSKGAEEVAKCEACDEADALKAEAEALKAEQEQASKCKTCPEAVQYIRTAMKAGKIAPDQAILLADEFKLDDTRFPAFKAELEKIDVEHVITSKASRNGLKLEDLRIAGGSASDPDTIQSTTDKEYQNRRRRQLGLKEVM